MGRSPCCDKNGIKKGPWTQEEDLKLRQYIQRHGPGNWRTLPKKAGLQRCGKSCRLRWTNYLRPDIKRGRFSSEEEGTIIQLHGVLGNKWSAIATHLPGRTDNEIKNYWNTHIRKRLIRNGIDPVTHTTCLDLSSILNSTQFNLLNLLNFQTLVNQDVIKLATLLATSSSNQENQELFNNNHINPINQNPNQQIQNCTSTPSSFPSIQLLDQAHIMPVNDQKNNGQSSQEKLIPPCFTDNSVKASENSSFQRLNIENKISSIQNLDFDPVSSSPTHVHSSSTFINSNITEDKRGSRCSDMFQLEIPESLEFDYFM